MKTTPADTAKQVAEAQARPSARNCPVLRRMVVTHGSLDLSSGKIVEGDRETVVRPCDAPLFGAAREAGICRSCATGWQHPDNRVAPL